MAKNTLPEPTDPVAEPAPPAPKPTAKGFHWRRRYTVGLIVLLIIVVLAGYGLWLAQAVRQHTTDGANHLQTAVNSIKGDNVHLDQATLARLRQELSAAQSDFQAAQDSLGPTAFALPLLGWLPSVGYDVSHLPSLLDIARQGTQAGLLVLDGVQPALSALEPGGTEQSSSKALRASDALATPQAQADFGQAAQLLDGIVVKRADLDPARFGLAQARQALGQLDSQLPTLRDGLQLARSLPALLPTALGKTAPVNYLIMIQNSDELRPTGGFISAVGLLGLNAGRMNVTNFQDSYLVDANPKTALPPPIEPMARYMGAAYLVTRDANWWPDFPTSARQVAQLYGQNQPTQPDGVIALDMTAVAAVFQALGPLDLPEYNEHLTAQNFEERLHYYYLPPGTVTGDDWWLKRKEFIGKTMQALIGRLNGASASDYVRLLGQLSQATGQKHLQFYFNNADLESQLTQRKLDGAQTTVAPSTGEAVNDYLMITEANVGFNKVNPKIDRTIAYRVVSAGTGASMFASLTITYTSRAGVREGTQAGECVKVTKYDSSYNAMTNGCYWNYLRVYAPAGSRLRSSSGIPADSPLTAGVENNRAVFASQVVVPPGGTLVLTLDYLLPGQMPAGAAYNLSVQKQAGLPAVPYNLQVNLGDTSRIFQTRLDGDVVWSSKK